MSKILKSLMRNELERRFDGVDSGVFIRTQGLNSEKTYAFRAALRAKNVRYTVVRNALAKQMLEDRGYKPEELDQVLNGPLGVVYAPGEEGSALHSAKVVATWKQETRDKVVDWAGAFMDGAVLDAKAAATLKDAPTKDQARAQLLGALQAPVVKLVSTIREPAARMVFVFDAIKRKLEEGGESAA